MKRNARLADFGARQWSSESCGYVDRPLSIDHWPQHASLVNSVGAQLQREHGAASVPSHMI